MKRNIYYTIIIQPDNSLVVGSAYTSTSIFDNCLENSKIMCCDFILVIGIMLIILFVLVWTSIAF